MVYKTLTMFYHFPLRASARTSLVHNTPTEVYNSKIREGGVCWSFQVADKHCIFYYVLPPLASQFSLFLAHVMTWRQHSPSGTRLPWIQDPTTLTTRSLRWNSDTLRPKLLNWIVQSPIRKGKSSCGTQKWGNLLAPWRSFVCTINPIG